MKGTLWKRSWVPALAVALAIAACGDQSRLPTEQSLGSGSAQFAKGGNDKGRANGHDKAPGVDATRKGGKKERLKVAYGQLPADAELYGEVLVQPDQGGEIQLDGFGHRLLIPAGIYDRETLFRMRASKKMVAPDSVVAVVDLRATQVDPETGEEINVGELGFNGKLVTLEMSAHWLDLGPQELSKLTILWMHNSTTGEEPEGAIERVGHTLRVGLSHFSQYALAYP